MRTRALGAPADRLSRRGARRDARVVISEARVGGVKISDAMVFELDGEGRIERVRPHLRPWLALTIFALMVAPAVVRRPGAVLRALQKRSR